MKIGILGVGHIGKSIALALAAAGHDVKVANSRGPDSIADDVLATGARAVTGQEAVQDVDVVILSMPATGFSHARTLLATVPDATVVIDTSNYYPHRDGEVPAIEAGQIEAEWVGETLGRRIVKAWNAIGSDSLARKGRPKGAEGRIAIPVAGDLEQERALAIALVDQTGFDGYDAGPLFEAWRTQPGAPAYCTDLTHKEMGPALAATDRARLPQRRDLAVAVIMERMGDGKTNPKADWAVQLGRVLYM